MLNIKYILQTVLQLTRVVFIEVFFFYFFFENRPPEIYRALPTTGNACWTVQARAIGVLTHRNIMWYVPQYARVRRTIFVIVYTYYYIRCILYMHYKCIYIGIQTCINEGTYNITIIHIYLYTRSTGDGTTHDPVRTTGNPGQCGVHVGRRDRNERRQPPLFFQARAVLYH